MRIYVVFLKSINYPIREFNQDERFGDLVKGRQVFGCFFLKFIVIILIREEREKGEDKYLGLVNMNIGSIQKLTRLKSSGLDWDPPHVG
jgi:hypothetical protein